MMRATKFVAVTQHAVYLNGDLRRVGFTGSNLCAKGLHVRSGIVLVIAVRDRDPSHAAAAGDFIKIPVGERQSAHNYITGRALDKI